MAVDNYDKACDAGRQGHGYSGGGSIEYAGWAAGNEMRARQESAAELRIAARLRRAHERRK